MPGVTLPWWDWTESRDLPEAYAAEALDDGNQNPLASTPIAAVGGMREPGWPERTSRPEERADTWLPGGGLPDEAAVAEAMNAANFDDFTLAAENLHNASTCGFAGVGEDRPKASDHCPVVVELQVEG